MLKNPLLLLLTFALLLLAPPVAFAIIDEPRPRGMHEGGPRVRAGDERSASLLLQGIDRSESVRRLVDAIERGNVIVYIQMQPSLKRQLAGSLSFLTATEMFRYVRVSLNPYFSTDLLISTLAHELQHALEVVREPSVVSIDSFLAYYITHGLKMPAHLNGWDTQAARDMGDEVRRELSGTRTARVAESIQAFDPKQWHILYRRTRSMLPP